MRAEPGLYHTAAQESKMATQTPAPASSTASTVASDVATVEADASKVKAFLKSYGLYVLAFVVGAVLGHLV